MTCVHLQKLYQLCMDHDLKLGGADLIHIVCQECGEKEVCPSVLMDEYDSGEPGRCEPPEPGRSEPPEPGGS
jgi:hypothetical protein